MIKCKAYPKEAGHFIPSDDEDLSECSITFGSERSASGYHSPDDDADLSQTLAAQINR